MTRLRAASLPFVPALAASLGAAGCEKTNDVPRLQQETEATVASYQERIDELIHRAQALAPRYSALPRDAPDAMNAQRTMMQARAAIERARVALRQASTRAPKTASAEELTKLLASLRADLDVQVRETAGSINTVESWIAINEQRKLTPSANPAGTVQTGQPSESAPEK